LPFVDAPPIASNAHRNEVSSSGLHFICLGAILMFFWVCTSLSRLAAPLTKKKQDGYFPIVLAVGFGTALLSLRYPSGKNGKYDYYTIALSTLLSLWGIYVWASN
jgi:hypothetical protein